MPARAIASGTIAFGLVSIPCKLFPSASPSDGIHFNNLHRECGSRVKYQFHCPQHDTKVGRDEMVKGYEFAKGQFVTFEKDELDAVQERTSGGIDITEFVPIDQVDPIYYAKGYYLGPDQGAGRAYHLLAEALRQTKLVAVAKYAARGKQYLVLLRPVKQGIVMQQLHYPAEVRPIAEVGIEDTDVKEGELQLAIQLVKQGAVKTFQPDKYHDEVRERIEALIAKKLEGEDITQLPEATPKAQVIDLMTALKASLGAAASGGSEARSEADAEAARKGPKRASDLEGAAESESEPAKARP
jgi:DNA end-binding protein Ku